MNFEKQIIIKTSSRDEELAVAEKIHKMLVGNPDYVESRIALNMSADRKDGTKNEVHIYIFPDAKTDIEFTVCDRTPAEKSDTLSWAEKEVEIACKQKTCDYDCACYETALKAFTYLLKDGRPRLSIRLTQHILNRLINGKPLMPIYDTPDIWNEIYFDEKNSIMKYQCKRMSSLFKEVHADGTVEYGDIDRIVSVDPLSGTSLYSALANRIIDEMFPISLPYFPTDCPYTVICEEFLTDKKNGDFDTVGVMHVTKPDGERVEINRYFKDAPIGWEEIDKVEYDARKEKKIG